MRSLSDFPLLETFYEAGVGFYAGPVPLYEGKRVLVRHAIFFDEICDYDRSAARDALKRDENENCEERDVNIPVGNEQAHSSQMRETFRFPRKCHRDGI